jgi:maleylacetate reductase
MNALAHCVEALWARDGDPITDVLALEGVRLLHDHLPTAYDTASPGPRGQVQLAACLAGSALGTAGTSIHHALCHLLGGMFDLPHAETHAILLPYAVCFATRDLPETRRRLAGVLGCKPDEVAGGIWDLGARVGTPHGLRTIGLQREQAEQAARVAVERALTSPQPLDHPTARQLLLDAWTGHRPVRRSPRVRERFDVRGAADPPSIVDSVSLSDAEEPELRRRQRTPGRSQRSK